MLALKRAVGGAGSLSAESVERPSLSLECVDDVEGGDSLSLGVFRIRNGVPNHVFRKDLQNSSRLFVNQTGNAFHSTSPSKTPNGGFRNSLDVVTKDLPYRVLFLLYHGLTYFAPLCEN